MEPDQSADPGRTGVQRVGVVTVSFRSQSVLPGFLASIPAAAGGPVPVVVADNHPDGAVEPIAVAGGARYLPLPRNLGYGGGMNSGVAQLPPELEWVVIANPDVVFEPNAISTLVATGDGDGKISSVGPRILTPDGDVYPSARRLPSLRTGIGHALFATAWPDNPWSRAYRHPGLTTRTDVGWLSGACLVVRRSSFDRIGGFDEAFFMYFEDVDLGQRLAADGSRNVYEPSASVVHSGAHSTSGESAAMIQAHHQSARLYLERRYPSAIFAPLRLLLRAGLRLRSMWEVRRLRTP